MALYSQFTNEVAAPVGRGRYQGIIGIGPLKSNKVNDMINDSAEKAEILSAQVFAVKDAGTMPDKGSSHYPTIPDIDVTFNGIRNLLLKFEQVYWSR